jgi:hypothetical protein
MHSVATCEFYDVWGGYPVVATCEVCVVWGGYPVVANVSSVMFEEAIQ